MNRPNHFLILLFFFNKNIWQLSPAAPLSVGVIPPGQNVETSIPLSTQGQALPPSPTSQVSNFLQVALKNNVEVFYFNAVIPPFLLLSPDSQIERKDYLEIWKSIPNEDERIKEVFGINTEDSDALLKKLQNFNLFFLAKKNLNGRDLFFMCARMLNGSRVMLEVTLNLGNVKCAIRSTDAHIIPLFEQAIEEVLQL